MGRFMGKRWVLNGGFNCPLVNIQKIDGTSQSLMGAVKMGKTTINGNFQQLCKRLPKGNNGKIMGTCRTMMEHFGKQTSSTRCFTPKVTTEFYTTCWNML